MKFIGMFFLFFTIADCSHTTRATSPPLPASEQTNKTPGIPTATTALPRYEVLPAPKAKMLDEVVESMLGIASHLSPRDQGYIKIMIDVLKRANHEEIASLIENNRTFPIEDPFQNIFWHAAIELGNIFLVYRSCQERVAYLEGNFFPKRLSYLSPEWQLLYRAAGQFLARHANLEAYRCERQTWVAQ